MRLIDADELVERLGKDPLFGLYPRFVRESTINFMPTVDAVEVVRCKDCRKRGGEDCPMYHWQDISIYQGNDIWDEDHEITDNTEDGGFCHKGERRGDD